MENGKLVAIFICMFPSVVYGFNFKGLLKDTIGKVDKLVNRVAGDVGDHVNRFTSDVEDHVSRFASDVEEHANRFAGNAKEHANRFAGVVKGHADRVIDDVQENVNGKVLPFLLQQLINSNPEGFPVLNALPDPLKLSDSAFRVDDTLEIARTIFGEVTICDLRILGLSTLKNNMKTDSKGHFKYTLTLGRIAVEGRHNLELDILNATYTLQGGGDFSIKIINVRLAVDLDVIANAIQNNLRVDSLKISFTFDSADLSSQSLIVNGDKMDLRSLSGLVKPVFDAYWEKAKDGIQNETQKFINDNLVSCRLSDLIDAQKRVLCMEQMTKKLSSRIDTQNTTLCKGNIKSLIPSSTERILPTRNMAGTSGTTNDVHVTMTLQSNVTKDTSGNNVGTASGFQKNLTGEARKVKINIILLVATLAKSNLI